MSIRLIRGLQSEAGAWAQRTFGEPNVAHQALVLVEECGEVARCVVKSAQGIRGTRAQWHTELGKELADVLIAAAVLADQADIDLSSAVEDRWRQIIIRSVNHDPVGSGAGGES